ncbi:septum site-determining protein MinC [Psychrobacter arenosus]|uniref:septum site-determining protein MinC n=1 Tax=Psychrobacter arenosus TaxID=256326 RepID=UPI00191A21AA|nr:septum site-determining protein MinC [Psychrobacter arenosus]
MSNLDTEQAAPLPEHSVIFYGKMLNFTQIKLQTADLAIIEAKLEGLLSNKNSQIPMVINSEVDQDLDALIDLLWSWGLQPIGVITGVLDEKAKARKLAIFPGDGKRIERIKPKVPAAAQTVNATETVLTSTAGEQTVAPSQTNSATALNSDNMSGQQSTHGDHISSMIYDQMLRSGQSINHVGGDLILTNSVNNGAEAITDNSLHIYGRANGRLVAGATGDKDARIFCQSFNPSLVSVAGTYCLRDNIPEEMIDQPVQVRYQEGEGLVFTVMNNT